MENIRLEQPPRILEGFAFTEWPDLTCERNPALTTHTSTTKISAAFDGDVATPSLLLALARVLGAYCGTTDVLLARMVGDKFSLVRASWSNGQTWQELGLDIGSQLQDEKMFVVAQIRHALGLTERQYPCLAALTLDPKNGPASASDFPLTIHYDQSTKNVFLSSRSTLIHPSISEQLLSQVVLLLEHALTNLATCVSTLPQFPTHLSSVYNRASEITISTIYPHLPVVEYATDYLRGRAISTPDSVAVRWFPNISADDPFNTSEAITYGELDQLASKFARWLVSKGLRHEDRVAVCLTRNLFFHAALMGIMRAGGCYVPIDPDLPPERKAYIARDSNATFVLTTTELSPIELFGSATVFTDDLNSRKAIEDQDGSPFNIATVDGLSYMLYTSGTTGNPKGCLLTNKGLAQAILALSSTAADVRMGNLREGRYLAVASIAFDVHLGETFVPIALGMPLFSAPRSELLEDLPFYVNILGITHLGIVPSLIEATLNAASDETGKTELRYIASGGEKMSDSILDKWANHPQVRLANFYGPSEVTIGCCARYMDSKTPRANIGRPLANVSGYVVDSDMQILPRGGVGELVVEGPLVGRGYHGRPDLTQNVFLEWPEKSCWAYRTGDLVRMLPDSTIEILGRIDTQIKLRGVRIESEGISAIVRKATPPSPDMALDATTVLAKHPSIGSDQLISFVTWNPTVPIAVRKSTRPTVTSPPRGLLSAIRSICNEELASYMRPSHVIPLTWLPLNSNGKTDAKILADIFKRLAVQELTGLMAEDKVDSSTRCSETEETVYSILKQHAPSHPGAPYPDLSVFECGLDSMGVIRFTSDLKARFRTQLSASDIMKNPLLKDIAQLVLAPTTEDDLSTPELVSDSAIHEVHSFYPLGTVETVLPPFPIQQGVVSRSAELDSLYVQHVILQCHDGVSLPKLKEAWRSVYARHPMLRTVFHIDQWMVQVVLKPSDAAEILSERTWNVDSSSFVTSFKEQLADSLTRDINRSLSSIPPLRLTLFSLPTATVVVLSIHHALYDGSSLPLILSDIESAYFGSDLLPAASLHDILARIASNDLNAAQRFWTKYFGGFTKAPSPWNDDWQDSSPPSLHMSVAFTAPLSSVKATAVRHQVTLQALLTFAFAKLIAVRLYKSRDVSFGVIRSGRLLPVENIDSAICPTISLIPMRVTFDQDATLLSSIQAKIAEMVEHENVPLSQIQNWVQPGETMFDALFSVSVYHQATSSLWTPLNEEPPHADYPLAVEALLDPGQDSLTIRAGWLDGCLASDFVSQFLSDFEKTALDVDSLADQLSPLAVKPVAGGGVPPKVSEEASESSARADTTIITDIRRTASEFLGVSGDVLTDSTSFVSLGLDSIKAVGLAKRINKLGYNVNSVEVLKASTIQKLAEVISAKSSRDEEKSQAQVESMFEATLASLRKKVDINSLKLSPGDNPGVYPATALQAGMLSQTIASSGALYVHSFPIALPSGLDMDRLRSAWRIAVDMYAILRTSFHFIQETGQWTQVVHTRCPLSWSSQEISNDQDYAAGLQSLLNSLVWEDDTAFARPPVWLRLFVPSSPSSSTRPRLVLVMHHALYDGLSVPKLFSNLDLLYRGESLHPPVQFSTVLAQILYQEKEGTTFWTKLLRGFRPMPLAARSSTSESTVHKSVMTLSLDYGKVSAALGSAGVTLQCLFQAALAKLLSSLTHSDDVVFGHVVSGRGIPGSEHVIGPMLNTIPCRVKLGKDISSLQLLHQVHRSNLEVLPWQQASLRSIQRGLGVEQLWDCLFTFQPAAIKPQSIWTLESTEEHEIQIQYSLHVEVEQQDTGFTLRVASRHDGFDHRSLSALANELGDFVTTILNSMGAKSRAPAAIPTVSKVHPTYSPSPAPAPRAAPVIQESVTNVSQNTPPSAQNDPTPENTSTAIPSTLLSILKSVAPDAKALTLDTPLASLGVDSITAIQIAGKCRLANLPLRAVDLVNARTLGEIVAKLPSIVAAAPVKTAKPNTNNPVSKTEFSRIVARFGDKGKHIEKILPMAPGMKYLVSEWQFSKATRFQCIFPFRLPPTVDVARLKNAWNLFIKRHDIYRSTFASAPGSGEPRVVTFSKDFQGEHWFEETLDDDAFHGSLIARLGELAKSPLGNVQPPSRVILFRSRSKSHAYAVFHLHHFHYDAWCLPIVIKTLSAYYHALDSATIGDISPFLLSFPVAGDNRAEQERYFKSAFPVPFKPALFPQLHTPRNLALAKFPKRVTRANASLVLRASECERKARSLGSSLNAVAIAVWASVQAKYAASFSATFGVFYAGRNGFMDGIDRFIAPCINVIPLHVPLADSILETARYIQQDLFRRTPEIEQSDLQDIHDWTRAEGTLLFNSSLNVLKVPRVSETDILFEPVRPPHSIAESAAFTVTSTLDEINYGRLHRTDVMVDIALVEQTDSIYLAIDSDGDWMSEKQTEKVLEDCAELFNRVFSV